MAYGVDFPSTCQSGQAHHGTVHDSASLMAGVGNGAGNSENSFPRSRPASRTQPTVCICRTPPTVSICRTPPTVCICRTPPTVPRELAKQAPWTHIGGSQRSQRSQGRKEGRKEAFSRPQRGTRNRRAPREDPRFLGINGTHPRALEAIQSRARHLYLRKSRDSTDSI